MLKRTMILLGLTITIGALLLVTGCGGNNNMMPISDSQDLMLEKLGFDPNSPLRLRGNGNVTLGEVGSPAVAHVSDPDGIASVVLLWRFGSNSWKYEYFFVRGAKTYDIPLRYFGQAECALGLTDMQGAADSGWRITRDGQVIRIF